MKVSMHKILVPVDFSSTSIKAFILARELAGFWDGELHLVHVLDTDFLTGAVHITIEPLEESLAKWKKRAEEKLKAIYHDEEGGKLTGEIHIRKGKPHEEILKLADELEAGLIVIGSHARKGLERAIFGSVAEKVTKMATIPVLVVK
ncbi:MAG: universal stress protein [bacterium]|nr:MAG: universal stress protein [bacterium]